MQRLILIMTMAALLGGAVAAQRPAGRAEFGEIFPGPKLANLNAGLGGADTVDLSRVIGKRPVVFCYWIAGNQRSEAVLQELQTLVDELGPGKLLLYGMVTERPGLGADKIVSRMRALKIRAPVLNDEGFRIGRMLDVRSVPSITVLDKSGRLRLANGGSLRQTLEYNLDVAAGLRRVADTGELGTYGALPRWYPVKELVGQPSPDFEAPFLGQGEIRRWSEMIRPDAVNVLVFWSVDCPHCRESLPMISKWLQRSGRGINLVSAAKVNNAAVREKTEEFRDESQLAFPILEDEQSRIADQFMVVSTPTFVIVGPDGIVESVILSGNVDVPKHLESKRQQLLEPQGS